MLVVFTDVSGNFIVPILKVRSVFLDYQHTLRVAALSIPNEFRIFIIVLKNLQWIKLQIISSLMKTEHIDESFSTLWRYFHRPFVGQKSLDAQNLFLRNRNSLCQEARQIFRKSHIFMILSERLLRRSLC
jgi:hypothetical protein